MKKFGTGIRGRQSALPAPRHLPLVDILVDAQAELQELVVASGLKVLAAMLEEDRVAVCGPRYAHQPARRASRAGHAPSEVVLGGRKVALRRPRVRLDGQEVALPSVQAFYEHGSAHLGDVPYAVEIQRRLGSYAHTWFRAVGGSGRGRPVATRRRGRRRGTYNPAWRQSRCVRSGLITCPSRLRKIRIRRYP